MAKIAPPSKIFFSAHRGYEETAIYKRYYTFNFKNYQNAAKKSFGQLIFFNDEYLAPKGNVTYSHEEDMRIIVLPIAGALKCQSNTHTEELVKPEEIKIIELAKGASYTLNNPFEEEWINYLHIGLKTNAFWKDISTLKPIAFEKMDELVSFGFDKEDESAGYMGIYQARSEENYKLKNSGNGIFIYVIKGAFEVQGSLLENRDGLSVTENGEIEFEALSENAIIMLLEVKLN